MAEAEEIDLNLFRTAEKIDVDWKNNKIRLRYQDGREVELTEVRVDVGSLVRALYEGSVMTRQQARSALRNHGLPVSILKGAQRG